MATKKTAKVKKMDGFSADVRQEKLDALKQLVPEAFADGKIDVKRLQKLVGEDVVTEDERYRLEWSGKAEVFDEVAERSSCTLTLDEKRSTKDWKDSNNIFIEGENLEVLRTLQKAYSGKVKMIYIDPPYNTGKDFVYNDNFRETEEEYCDDECNIDENGLLKKALKLNSRDNGRFHSNWLSMIYPRLYLARNLLQEDGVIFVSIDDNEVHNLRMVMNEVFGEENFVACVANVNNPKGRSDDKYIATAHEYLCVYAKNLTHFSALGFEPGEEVLKRYNKTDDSGRKYREIDLRKTGDNDLREDRPNLFYYFLYDKKSGDLYPTKEVKIPKGYIQIKPTRADDKDGNWRWGIDTAKAKIDDLIPKKMPNRGVWGVFEKDYLENRERIKATSAWTFKDVNSERGSEEFINLGFDKRLFPKPKPIGLITRALQIATGTDERDIVLDFFGGSGSFAQAVMQQNAEDDGDRKYICVQMPEETPEGSEALKAGYKKISDIAIDRIKKAATKIKKDYPKFKGDLGVRVYKESESHFPQWHSQVFKSDKDLEQAMIDYSKAIPTGTAFDRATEVLLKLGYPLTTEITEMNGYMLAADEVALVLDTKFQSKDLQKVLDATPKTVVVLEKLFKKDQDKINFALRCKEAKVIFQTV